MSGYFRTEDGRVFSPEQRKASAKLTKLAIKKGELPEPTQCNRCKQTEGYISYHNHDYADPVKFCEALCWRCHAVWHSKHFAPEQVAAYFKAVEKGKRWPPLERPGWGALARDHGIVHPRDRAKYKTTGDCRCCHVSTGVMRYWFGPQDDQKPMLMCWWCWAIAWMNTDPRNKEGVAKYKAEMPHEPAMRPEWELMEKQYGIPTGQRGPQLVFD